MTYTGKLNLLFKTRRNSDARSVYYRQFGGSGHGRLGLPLFAALALKRRGR
jgi:hypothetical protein